MTESTVFELTFPCPDRPLSENESRRMQHWERSRRLNPWKEAVKYAWIQARGHREWIIGQPCTVQMDLPFSRGGRRDPSNYIGTVVKATVDMLVHLKVFPDDTPDWVSVIEPNILVGEMAVLRLIPRGARPSLRSRASLRKIEQGNLALCHLCQERLKFNARVARADRLQVIANVYAGDQWLRVEHYHAGCYAEAGSPYGIPAPPS